MYVYILKGFKKVNYDFKNVKITPNLIKQSLFLKNKKIGLKLLFNEIIYIKNKINKKLLEKLFLKN